MAEKKLPDWHGIPRDSIKWHPIVEPDLCTGCGICVLGCGPKVFRFDFENTKPVVAERAQSKGFDYQP